MQPSDALGLAAQIAVALAGFAGVVVAFRSGLVAVLDWQPERLAYNSTYENANYRWLRLRRDSLRSYSRSDGDVQLPLPRLSEINRQRLHPRFLCAGKSV